MASPVTDKLIEALQLTTNRIDAFLENNREFFCDVDPSPYGFLTFCSFLVTASYAPPRKYFPNTVVHRDEAGTEEFKSIVVQSMTQSLLQRHAEALKLMASDAERDEHAQKTGQQVSGLMEEKYSEYFALLKQDIERLAEVQANVYADLSAAFLRDVLGRQAGEQSDRAAPARDRLSLGLCLSTTISGLMAFFGTTHPSVSNGVSHP